MCLNVLKNNIKHILRQKQTGFFCKHKKAALSMIKLFHVFLMGRVDIDSEDSRSCFTDTSTSICTILVQVHYQIYRESKAKLEHTK